MTDEKIIQHIRAAHVDKAIKVLYKEYPKVQSLIVASGVSKAEARDTNRAKHFRIIGLIK